MVDVELLLSKPLVEQLLEQGHERVRCVVAVQPQGAVLLDQVWQLLPEEAAAAAAAAETYAAGESTAAKQAAAAPVAAAATAEAASVPAGAAAAEPALAAVTEDGLKLKLSLSGDAALHLGSEMSKQGPVRVLSVVVLAKGQRKEKNRPCSSGADSISTCSRSTSSTGSSVLAAAAAAAAVSGAVVPGVIAHLPLLLLPAAAATEMQGVIEAAVACGVGRLQANQQLVLRLVQDWALLMLLIDGNAGSEGSSSTPTASSSSSSVLRSPLQLMQHSLNDSLATYFGQHKLEQCLKLLQSVAGAASSSGPRAARLQRQQQQAAQQQQQQQTYKAHFSADFYLYTFKIANCTAQHPHDWSTCPFAHPREKARRRDPRLFEYQPLPCPDDKKGHTCPRGDSCCYTHNVYEFHLHPKRFRTQMCQHGAACTRPLCFFAHTLEELRVVEAEPSEEQQEQQQQQQQQQGRPEGQQQTAHAQAQEQQQQQQQMRPQPPPPKPAQLQTQPPQSTNMHWQRASTAAAAAAAEAAAGSATAFCY
ncbi:hypothetical protein COO60DRAFT_25223 [Scenedesmus sp. NREL 46B-D3]|nr:hypothetical protein COO60DRAFT_25223 [Scenedesmus sp. NREL 46B-D3]